VPEPTIIAAADEEAVKKTPTDPGFTPGGDDKKTAIVETTEDMGLKSSTTGSSSSVKSADDTSALDVKHTWRQNLVLYRGRITDRSLIKAFFQPFPLMIFPSVLFSTVVNGAFITWTMTSGIITHQVLLYPPYNLKPDTLAYIGLPGSVVGLLSSIVSGMTSDWLIKFMAHRNNGVYEPEFRLVIPPTVNNSVHVPRLTHSGFDDTRCPFLLNRVSNPRSIIRTSRSCRSACRHRSAIPFGWTIRELSVCHVYI
jgi:hypothetical protein